MVIVFFCFFGNQKFQSKDIILNYNYYFYLEIHSKSIYSSYKKKKIEYWCVCKKLGVLPSVVLLVLIIIWQTN